VILVDQISPCSPFSHNITEIENAPIAEDVDADADADGEVEHDNPHDVSVDIPVDGAVAI
jgi:hypothetical protein